MKSWRVVHTIGIIFCFVTIFVLTAGNVVNASNVRIVRIHNGTPGNTEQLIIEPENLRVTEGTVVIWVNQSTAGEIKITFEEGTKCEDVTSSSDSFNLKGSCFLTTWVPVAGTTSLKFNEAGQLTYDVENSAGIKVKGKIVVYFDAT